MTTGKMVQPERQLGEPTRDLHELVMALDSTRASPRAKRGRPLQSATEEAMAEYQMQVRARQLEQELREHLMTLGYAHYVEFRKLRDRTRHRRAEVAARARDEHQRMVRQVGLGTLWLVAFLTATLTVWLLWSALSS